MQGSILKTIFILGIVSDPTVKMERELGAKKGNNEREIKRKKWHDFENCL